MADKRVMATADLKRYRNALKDNRRLYEEIQSIRDRVDSTTTSYSWKVSQSAHNHTSKENLLSRLIDAKEIYGRQEVEAERIALQTELKIKQLKEGLCRRILRDRFLYGKSFDSIAKAEGYCDTQIKRKFKSALFEYADILEKEVLTNMNDRGEVRE